MSLKLGKADIAAMAKALDPEYADLVKQNKADVKRHKEIGDELDPEAMLLEQKIEESAGLIESIEQFAADALATAEEIFEKRAQFVVVGQLYFSKERGQIPPSDPEAIKLSLGWYSTEGDARSASESLWKATATGDEFRTWVLDVFHGTPADFHATQKEKYAEQEAVREQAKQERLKASIEKQALAAEVRANGGKGACDCEHQAYDHVTDGSSRGKCLECDCTKWNERKR